MARPCSVCAHPNREAIDRALVTSSASVRALAEQYGIGRGARQRHLGNHITETVTRAGGTQRNAAEIAYGLALTAKG